MVTVEKNDFAAFLSGFEMSNKRIFMTRADCIENLLSKKSYQDIGSHLEYLETVDMTLDILQETDITRSIFRVLKNCPSVVLKNKAKHLLSKWKTLYKEYNQSTQIKSGPNKLDEHPELCQVIVENINYEKQGQYEKLGPVISSSCLPSENSSKDISTNVKEDDTVQPECLGVSCLASKKTPPQDHTAALRCKCTEFLFEALLDSSTNNEENEKLHRTAEEIEQNIFAIYAKNNRKYKNCIRCKILNLKNPKNSHLKHNLRIGTLNPKTFAGMSVMEMAHDELKQLRTSYTESSVLEHQLPQNISGTHTNKIKCRRCEKFNCNVTIIARGILFLPGWVQNTNPDEQMMTYIICNECGEQWYHNRWICL